jgi:hypothetical protein
MAGESDMASIAWTPSLEHETHRRNREKRIAVLLLIGRTACPGCRRIGYLVVQKTLDPMHYCKCGCGWRGKVVGNPNPSTG